MSRLLFVAIVAATLALCAAATAGECRHFFQPVKQVAVVQHHVQAVQAVAVPVVYPQVYYQAGQGLEIEAAVAKALRRELQAIRQEIAMPQRATAPPPPADPRNILMGKCGKCHSGATPKAGLTIDGVTAMPCESVLESLRQIKDDKMPKGGVLSPEEKGLLMEALLALQP